VFEVADDVIKQAELLIQETMEGILAQAPLSPDRRIPISVSVSHGKTWGDAKD
jgi:DNA polymerase I-like protein with 3'-5' exonuclease and polymerase domains